MISPISSSFSNLKSFSFITIIMLTHHNWWSSHYKCYAALCQNWGCSAGTTSILTNREVRDPLRKKTALSGGKIEKNLSQFFWRLVNTYKKYILQKNWVKTAIPALSSGRSNLQRPIWGCHRQLDDRDHLVGQLTTSELAPSSPVSFHTSTWVAVPTLDSAVQLPSDGKGKVKERAARGWCRAVGHRAAQVAASSLWLNVGGKAGRAPCLPLSCLCSW